MNEEIRPVDNRERAARLSENSGNRDVNGEMTLLLSPPPLPLLPISLLITRERASAPGII